MGPAAALGGSWVGLPWSGREGREQCVTSITITRVITASARLGGRQG